MSENERELQLLSFRKASGLRTEPSLPATEASQGGSGGSIPNISANLQPPITPSAPAPTVLPPQGPPRQAASSSEGSTVISSNPTPQPAIAMVLVTTDVCLKSISKDSLPVGVPLCVQYDLPFKKEVYTRRLSTMFGGGKERRAHRSIVIDFVVAGELASFRATERMSGLIQELPVHAADIFESA